MVEGYRDGDVAHVGVHLESYVVIEGGTGALETVQVIAPDVGTRDSLDARISRLHLQSNPPISPVRSPAQDTSPTLLSHGTRTVESADLCNSLCGPLDNTLRWADPRSATPSTAKAWRGVATDHRSSGEIVPTSSPQHRTRARSLDTRFAGGQPRERMGLNSRRDGNHTTVEHRVRPTTGEAQRFEREYLCNLVSLHIHTTL